MSDLKLKMETEAEVVDKLMKKCQLLRVKDQLTLEDQVELVDILKDFEFLVHQVDNARDFVKQNGYVTHFSVFLANFEQFVKIFSYLE